MDMLVWETVFSLIALISIFIYFFIRQRNRINVGTYILLLYIVSLSLSFFENRQFVYSFEASLFFVLVLTMFLIPSLRIDMYSCKGVSLSNCMAFKRVCICFIIGGVLSYAFFLPVVYRLFTSGESLLLLRSSLQSSEVYFDVNLIYFIVTFFCQFYPIILISYFYSITYCNYSSLFNNLLLFSSTGYIINVLASVGRDGIILWSMSYLFAYLVFKPFMSKKILKAQKKIFVTIFFAFMLFFVAITMARFFIDSYDYGIQRIIDYGGEEFANFNNFYNKMNFENLDISLHRLFPILFPGREYETALEQSQAFEYRYGFNKFVFGSFIASFILEIGRFYTFLWAIMHMFINNYILKYSRKPSLGYIFYLTIISQLPLHGLFYYKLGYRVSNLYVIVVLLMCVYFSRKGVNAKR